MNHQAQVVDRETGEMLAVPFAQGTALAPAETAVSAVAMQARAQVEARFVMALHRPRDWDAVRVRLLNECRRPGFAEAARYKRPVGREQNANGQWVEKCIEGPSIRFAEAAIRAMGNIDIQSPTIYDDDSKRIVRVSATDLETNATYSRDITVEKIIEKKGLRKGQKPLGTRSNSYGDTVYLVPATPAEVDLRQGSEVSKSVRTLGLRLLPGDIQDECMQQCIETVINKVKEDPDAARKKLVDGFAAIGIAPDQLKKYVGQELASCSPMQIADLRNLYLAIKDGVTTWAELLAAKNKDAESEEGEQGKLDALRKKAAQHAAEVKASKQADKAPKQPKADAQQPAADQKPIDYAAGEGEPPALTDADNAGGRSRGKR